MHSKTGMKTLLLIEIFFKFPLVHKVYADALEYSIGDWNGRNSYSMFSLKMKTKLQHEYGHKWQVLGKQNNTHLVLQIAIISWRNHKMKSYFSNLLQLWDSVFRYYCFWSKKFLKDSLLYVVAKHRNIQKVLGLLLGILSLKFPNNFDLTEKTPKCLPLLKLMQKNKNREFENPCPCEGLFCKNKNNKIMKNHKQKINSW